MANTLILTVIGPDKPGLVAQIAACVADHGGNWLESRLVRLGGQFTGVLRVEVPEEKASALNTALRNLEGGALIAHAVSENISVEPPAAQLVHAEILGSDRPGILKAISKAFSRHAVNIEELSTERQTAPMSGALLFHARARIRLPSTAPLPELRAELEQIASDLMVELTLSEDPTNPTL